MIDFLVTCALSAALLPVVLGTGDATTLKVHGKP